MKKRLIIIIAIVVFFGAIFAIASAETQSVHAIRNTLERVNAPSVTVKKSENVMARALNHIVKKKDNSLSNILRLCK